MGEAFSESSEIWTWIDTLFSGKEREDTHVGKHTHTLRVRHCANHFPQTTVLVSKDSQHCLHAPRSPFMLFLQLEHPSLYCLPDICRFSFRTQIKCITNSQSSLKLTSIESVMPSSHLILCCPLLLLPPIPPSIRVFSNESTIHMRWPKNPALLALIMPKSL